MVSSRCKGNNLLNHIRQKNVEHTLSIEFCSQNGNPNYLKWVATFEINNQRFTGAGRNKFDAVNNVLLEAEDLVYNTLSIRK